MSDQFNILDYTSGPLMQTGQIIDRSPAGRTTKDDGGFQRGIKGSKGNAQYQILTTGQYSGITNITVNSIIDAHSNECVFDKVSGLMWSRTQTPVIYGTGTENLFWDDTGGVNEDIFEYCDQANISNLSGFSDWRIPNYNEIISLFILSTGIALPNNTAFPLITTASKWSSTTQVNNSANGYIFNFGAGSTGGVNKITTRLATILCRLGIE